MTDDTMNRRRFLRRLGGGMAAAALVPVACGESSTAGEKSAQQNNQPNGQMTYRKDTHGDEVSLIGYGCMRLPTVTGGSARRDTDEIDQEELNRHVDYLLEHGVNYFDTSPVYCQGRSETVMGKALCRHPRKNYKVATKLSNFSNWTRENSLAMYQASMRNLQVDYIDYYLLHSIGGGDDPMQLFRDRFIDNGMLDFLLEERAAGRIRNLGFSFHGAQEVYDYALSMHQDVHWDFVQIQMNYVDWHFAREVNPRNVNAEYLYGELASRDIPVVIMEPLLGGRLAGGDGSLTDRMVQMLKERAPEESLASWAFRFCGTYPKVLTSLSGMTYMDNIVDNVRTHSPLRPLSDEELVMLESIAMLLVSQPTVPCTACQYCMPCPFGIDIPGIFAHYNKSLAAGNVEPNRQSPEYRKAWRAFLVDYDRAVPTLRQADHCIHCGTCLSHCPQSIDIPAQLQRIDRYAEALKLDGVDLGSASA